MQVILRYAADAAFQDENERHRYYWAVTEDEISNGILTAKDTHKHCYWFKRVITDLRDNMSDKACRRFMDIGTGKDDEAFSLLEKVRNEKIPKALPAENITTYNVKWAEDGINPEKSQEHARYIDGFLDDFYVTLKRMIDGGVEDRNTQASLSKLEEEISQHLQFAQRKCETFHGRVQLLKDIEKKILKNRVTTLVGEPGCGKTALMSKVVQNVASWLKKKDNKVVVIPRFIGTTTDSASVRLLLTSVCQQLRHFYDRDDTSEIPNQMGPLKEHFVRILRSVYSDQPLVIILDSLDQLSDADAGRDMDWMPELDEIPEDVYFILSTLPGAEYDVLPELKASFPSESFIGVPKLEDADIKEIVTESLKNNHRTLQDSQMRVLQSACKECSLPLFLKLALDEAYRWKSYTTVDNKTLGKTVEQSINFLLGRVEKYHGHMLVSRALSYISATRFGLGESELEDILSCDDEVLNDVYQYHSPPLRRLPPLLWVRIRSDMKDYLTDRGIDNTQVVMWYHRQFIEVARTRYLSDKDKTFQYHQNLADFFLGKWSNGVLKEYTDKNGVTSKADRLVAKQPIVFEKREGKAAIFNHRKLNQLPYHLILSKQIDVLTKEVIFNYEFLHGKTKAMGIDSVINDMQLIADHGLEDEEIRILHKTLPMCRPGLLVDQDQLNCQLIARLLSTPNIEKYPRIMDLLKQAKKPNYIGMTTWQAFMKSGSGSTEMRFAGVVQMLSWILITDNQQYIVGGALGDLRVYVWRVKDGKLVKNFNCADNTAYVANGMMLCNEDKWIALTSQNHKTKNCDLMVWDLSTKEKIYNLEIGDMDDKNKKFPLCNLNGGKWVAAVTATKVAVVDIHGQKQVCGVDYPKEKNEANEMDELFLVGKDMKCAFRQRGSGFLHIYDFKKNKFVGHPQLCPEKFSKEMLCHICIVYSGIIVCQAYTKAPIISTSLQGQGVMCSFRTIDIKTGNILQDFPKYNMGPYVTGMEHLIPIPKKDAVFFNSYCKFNELDLKTGEVEKRMDFTAYICAIGAFSDNLVAMTDMQNIDSIDLLNLDRVDTSNLMQSYAYNAYGVYVLPGTMRYASYVSHNYCHVWDFLEKCEVRRVLFNIEGSSYESGNFINIKLSLPLTSTKMLIVTADRSAAVVDLLEGKLLTKLDKCMMYDKKVKLAEEAFPRHAVVDSNHFICINIKKKGEISIWNTDTGKEEATFSCGKAELAGIRTSTNGMLAVIIQKDGGNYDYRDMILYNAQTRKKLMNIKSNTSSDSLISNQPPSVHPDGTYVAFSDYNTLSIALTDTLQGTTRLIQDEEQMQKSSYCAVYQFSKPFNCLIAPYSNGTVVLYDLVTLAKVKQITANSLNAAPYKCLMSPDGITMVTNGASFASITVFDLNKGVNVGHPVLEKGVLDFCVVGRNILMGAGEVDGPVQMQIYDPAVEDEDKNMKADNIYGKQNLELKLF